MDAELTNVSNETALLASRNNHNEITQSHFQVTIELMMAELDKKNKLINSTNGRQEKRVGYLSN